jgi:ankyrin repeat protein
MINIFRWDLALQVAAYLGKLDVIKILLERGIDRTATNKFGATPLHTACSRKVIDVARILLKAGLSVKDKDNDGLTPFHSLSSSYVEIPESQANGNNVEIELATMLLEAGAELNAGCA